MSDDFNKALEALARLHGITVDELKFERLLRIATKEPQDKPAHVAASPEVIDEVLAAEHKERTIGWVHVSGSAWFPNPPAEDVGFALTDTEAAEAERAVDEEWGGAIRRKLGVARGHLDGLAQDLEEVGGWEETIKEIRQTLRETADPNPPTSLPSVDEFLVTANRQMQEDLAAAYEAAGISGMEDLAHHIRTLRAERNALLKEKQQVQGT